MPNCEAAWRLRLRGLFAEMQPTSYAAFPLIRLAVRSTPSPEGEGFYGRAFINLRDHIAALTQLPKGFSLRRGSAVGGGEV